MFTNGSWLRYALKTHFLCANMEEDKNWVFMVYKMDRRWETS